MCVYVTAGLWTVK